MEAGSVVLMDLLWYVWGLQSANPPKCPEFEVGLQFLLMHWMCTLSSWVNWDQESETIIWNIFLCRSDPTENDSVEGLRPNARGPGLVTFGVSKILILLEYLQRVLLMAHLLGPSSAPIHSAVINFWVIFCSPAWQGHGVL
jgi:hypothetical protein